MSKKADELAKKYGLSTTRGSETYDPNYGQKNTVSKADSIAKLYGLTAPTTSNTNQNSSFGKISVNTDINTMPQSTGIVNNQQKTDTRTLAQKNKDNQAASQFKQAHTANTVKKMVADMNTMPTAQSMVTNGATANYQKLASEDAQIKSRIKNLESQKALAFEEARKANELLDVRKAKAYEAYIANVEQDIIDLTAKMNNAQAPVAQTTSDFTKTTNDIANTTMFPNQQAMSSEDFNAQLDSRIANLKQQKLAIDTILSTAQGAEYNKYQAIANKILEEIATLETSYRYIPTEAENNAVDVYAEAIKSTQYPNQNKMSDTAYNKQVTDRIANLEAQKQEILNQMRDDNSEGKDTVQSEKTRQAWQTALDIVETEIKALKTTFRFAKDANADVSSVPDTNKTKGLTTDEINQYKLIKLTQGDEMAENYLDNVKPEANKRNMEMSVELAKEEAEEHPTFGAFKTVASDMASGFGAGIAKAKSSVQGKELDPYDPLLLNTRVSEASREGMKTGAEKKLGIEQGSTGAKVFEFGVDTGLSMVESGIRAMMGGAIGGIEAGLSAGASAYTEARDKGIDDRTATLRGIAQGVAEGFFEKYSLEKLIEAGVPANVKEAFINTAKQAFTEGSEEVNTELSNMITDDLILKQASELQTLYNDLLKQGYSKEAAYRTAFKQSLSQLALAGLGGALSGAGMGGMNQGRLALANNQYLKSVGKTSDLSRESIKSIRDELDTTESHYSSKEDYEKVTRLNTLLNDALKKYEKGKELSNYEKGAIENAINDTNYIKNYDENGFSSVEETAKKTEVKPLAKAEETKTETNQSTAVEKEQTIPYNVLTNEARKGVINVESSSREGRSLDLDGGRGASEVRELSKLTGLSESNVRRGLDRIINVKNARETGAWKQVKNSDLTPDGTSELGAYVASDEWVHNDKSELAEECRKLKTEAKADGKDIIFVSGTVGTVRGGEVVYTRGSTNGNTMVIQIDNLTATPTQIKRHEDYHEAKASNPNLVRDTKENFLKTRSQEELNSIVRKYADRYKWIAKDENGNINTEELDKVADRILEEIFADAYAGIESLSNSGERVSRAKRAATEEVKKAKGLAKPENTFSKNADESDIKHSQSENAWAYEQNLINKSIARQMYEMFDSHRDAIDKTGGGEYYIIPTRSTKNGAQDTFLLVEGRKNPKISKIIKIKGNDNQAITYHGDYLYEELQLYKPEEVLDGYFEESGVYTLYEPNGTKISSEIKDNRGKRAESAELARPNRKVSDGEGIRKSASENGELKYVRDAETKKTLKKAGIEVNNDGMARYSADYSWASEADQEKAAQALVKMNKGLTMDEAKRFIKSEMSLTNLVLNPKNIAMRYESDDRYEAIKKNSDYKQGTVDFNNNCPKRLPFTNLFDRLQKRNNMRVFTAEDLEVVRQTLIQHGMPVNCAMCYVEERRQRLGEIAHGFITAYKNGALLEIFDGKPAQKNIKKALDGVGNDTYIPNQADLITYEGLKNLDKEHPAIAKAFRVYNNARGMQAGRLVEGRAAYRRQILTYSQKRVDEINRLGGLRIFSYSDFEAINLLDIIQVIEDCSVMGIKIQGYTKVPQFAKAVKDTNMKLNRSLIAKGVGFKSKDEVSEATWNSAVKKGMTYGKLMLDLDPVEGINVNDKDFFDSTDSKSVGNIIVGISDEHIRLAMRTPMVDYIIPFHTGLEETLLKKKGIDHWTNYKNFQSEREWTTNKKGQKVLKKASEQVNIYTDVLEAWEKKGTPIKNKKEFTEAFLQVCKEKNLVPRFAEFLDTDSKGNYVYTEGYYKMLLDFKMFDKNGNILPQEQVVPRFDDRYNTKLMKDYVKNLDKVAITDELYNDTVENLNKDENRKGREVVHSQDSDGNALTELQQKYFEKTKAVNEDGQIVPVYHGSVREFFTFDRSYANVEGDMGKGFYFTNQKSDAEGNYKSINGADFTSKLEREAERMVDEDDSLDYDETVGKLRKKYATKPTMMPSYLNITNPVYVGDYNGNRETYLFDTSDTEISRDDYDSDDDYYEALDEEAAEVIEKGIANLDYEFEAYEEDIRNILYDHVYDGGITLQELKDELNERFMEDYNGDMAGNEIARQLVEGLGYDGIIDSTVSRKFRGMKLNPDTVHYIVFNSNQAKLMSNESPTENEDVRYSQDDLGYHAGDLGKAEYLANQGYGRGTGHFGTGTYFVGDKEKISRKGSGYSDRPQHAVDFSNYNLYKITDSEEGYKLHDFLKEVDGINRDFVDYIRSDDFETQVMPLSSISDEKLAEMYDLESLDDYKKKWVEKYPDDAEFVDEWAKEDYENEVLKEARKKLDDLKYDYDKFRERYRNACKMFGTRKVNNALDKVIEYKESVKGDRYNFQAKKDSYATVFMKALGYDGIDVRGTNLDNTDYGSVIYDLKPDTVKYSQDYSPTFYSKLQREIQNFKGDKIGAASAETYLKGRGVKEEEIKWSGIRTFLEGKKSVTKEELMDYLKSNELVIKETVMDTEKPSEDVVEKYLKEYGDKRGYDTSDIEIEDYDEYYNRLYVHYADGETISINVKEMPNVTKWQKYKLDGGENYREILFKMPNSDFSNVSMKRHWGDDKGVLAHARVQDFKTPDGKKVLFIDEIQSDWHNDGSKNGYDNEEGRAKKASDAKREASLQAKEDKLREKFVSMQGEVNSIENEVSRLAGKADWVCFAALTGHGEQWGLDSSVIASVLEHATDYQKKTVAEYYNLDTEIKATEKEKLELWDTVYLELAPEAPFSKNYTDYVLKVLLRQAAENDYDYLAWTNPDMQMDRYNPDRETNEQLGVKSKKPNAIAFEEGYQIEYGHDIPTFLNKYGKQWGTKVDTIHIGEDADNYDIRKDKRVWTMYDAEGNPINSVVQDEDNRPRTESEARDALLKGVNSYNVLAIPVNDAMKQSVLYEGQPMYSQDDTSAKIQELVKRYGALPKGETVTNGKFSTRQYTVPKQTSDIKLTRKFIGTVLESGVTSKDMDDRFNEEIVKEAMSYTPISNNEAIEYADKIMSDGIDIAQKRWDKAHSGTESMTKKDIVLGEKLIMQYAEEGNTEMVVKMAQEVAAEGTRAGQEVQAMRILKKMAVKNPAIGLGYIKNTVDQLEKETGKTINIDPELAEKYVNAENEEEAEKAASEIYKNVADQLPNTVGDKLRAWRYLSMLGNPRTHVRNLVGNALFVPAVQMKNAIGAALELGQKEKTKSIFKNKDAVAFAKADFYNVKGELTDEQKGSIKKEIEANKNPFKTLPLAKAYDFNSNMLEKEDEIFLNWHYVNALAQYMTANKLTAEDMQKQTLAKARKYAINEAKKATYRDASKFAAWLNQGGKAGKVANILLEGALPFKKTPTNILKRGIEYSPIGLTTTLWKYGKAKVQKKNVNANEIIDGLASGLTGTGITLMGMLCASLGFVTGGFDKDEKDLEKLKGNQEYSVKLFGKTFTIDWAAPAALPFFVGAELMNALSQDNSGLSFSDVADLAVKVIDPMQNLSMLDGLNSTLEAIQNSESPLSDAALEIFYSLLGQFVPTILGQAARTIDPVQRINYQDKNLGLSKNLMYFMEKVQNKIPFFSRLNDPYLNEWGQENVNDGNLFVRALENFVFPWYDSTLKNDKVTNEVERVKNETGENTIPKKMQKYWTEDGETRNLTSEEYTRYQRTAGQTSYNILDKMIEDPRYDGLTAQQQAQAIKLAYDYAKAVGRISIQGMKSESNESGYEPDSWISNAINAYNTEGTEAYDTILNKVYSDVLDLGKSELEAMNARDLDMSVVYDYVTNDKTPKITDVPSNGYKSSDKLYDAIGSANVNEDWHHIVEQEQKKFKAEQIQNSNNVVSIKGGAKSMHNLMTQYYQSKQDFTNGKTVSEWLKTKSFEEQWQFGVDYMSQYGQLVPAKDCWYFVPEDSEKIEKATEELKYNALTSTKEFENWTRKGHTKDEYIEQYEAIQKAKSQGNQKSVIKYILENDIPQNEWWFYWNMADYSRNTIGKISDYKNGKKVSYAEPPRYLAKPEDKTQAKSTTKAKYLALA